MKIKLFLMFVMLFGYCSAQIRNQSFKFDDYRPANITDQKWSELKVAAARSKLLPSPAGMGGGNSKYGSSISVDGDMALVGAPGIDLVYVLRLNNGSWQQEARIMTQDRDGVDNFGYSVSLWGNRALIGATSNGAGSVNDASGSAYVFDFDGTSWNQTAKIRANDASSNDRFGHSVSLFGDRMLIGAVGDDENGYHSGSAYVFDFDGANWSQTSKLIAADGSANDEFGYSVSLSGDRALIGAQADDDNGVTSGSTYVFDFIGAEWSQSVKLMPNDASSNDYFGRSVVLSKKSPMVTEALPPAATSIPFKISSRKSV
jgi:hypothetical protein